MKNFNISQKNTNKTENPNTNTVDTDKTSIANKNRI